MTPPKDRFARLLLLGLVAGTSALAAVLLARPSWWWPLTYHAVPAAPALAWGGAFLAVALLATGPRTRAVRNLALAGLLVGLYSSLRAFPLGDFKIWRTVAETDSLFASELLACFFLHLAHAANGLVGVNWLPPIAGGVTALAYFHFCDWYFGTAPRVRRLTAAAYLASGFHLLFTVGYTECTQLAAPFVIAFVFLVVRIARRGSRTPAPREAGAAAAAIALAALVHGQGLFLLPALPLVLVVTRGGFAAARRELAAAGLVFTVVVGAVVGLLALAGFTFVVGYLHGGGGGPFLELADIWPDKATHVANAALLVGPVLLFWPWILRAAARRERSPRDPRGRWALHVVAGGAIAFVCLWDFDLGFPADYDLMVSLLIPLHVALVELMLAALGGPDRGGGDRWRAGTTIAAALALAFGAVSAWSVIGALTLGEHTLTFGPEEMRARTARPVLELRTTPEGDVLVSVDRRPDDYEEGWILFSYRTDHPLGAGGLFGLEPDHLTSSGWVQKPAPGAILHFTRSDGDRFPDRPAAIPWPIAREPSGLVLDAVAVFALDDGRRVVGVSNLVRWRR